MTYPLPDLTAPIPRPWEAYGAPSLRAVRPQPELPAVLRARDPAMIRRVFPWIAAITDHYFRTEVEGAEHLTSKASIIAATHNGAGATPDLFGMMVAFWRRFGLETPGWGLMHGLAFRVPGLGPLFEKLGAIPATRENARTVLAADAPVFLCPGGDVDALKPFRDRHRVMFDGRRGFLRLAIREQVPVVPVVSVGAHETLFVLNDGRRTAETLGLSRRFRLKTIPLALSFPFGLTIAGVPSLPLPSKVRIRVLPPIALDEPPDKADDTATLERCALHVKQTMQRAVDDLAAQRRWPVLG